MTLTSHAIVMLAKLFSGFTVRWIDIAPDTCQRVYFANHTSHLDVVLVWSALPGEVRHLTRPVAAKDYWEGGRVGEPSGERDDVGGAGERQGNGECADRDSAERDPASGVLLHAVPPCGGIHSGSTRRGLTVRIGAIANPYAIRTL
jgi:hypothetical protein